MAGIKSFIDKVKEKNSKYQATQKEKQAQNKGFSSAASYDFYSSAEKTRAEESAKAQLRKKELKRIRDEAHEDIILGRTGKYHKIQKKVAKGFDSFQKGTGVYNDMIGGMQSLGSGYNDMYPVQNSRQAYASGYGIQKTRRKSRTKKTKKHKSRPRKPQSFFDQFMQY